MLDLQTILIFSGAAILLALTPGPDNLFVLAQSVRQGARAGLILTLGLATGLAGHTAAVMLGIASLLQTSAFAFSLLKFAGATYLLYLAWGALRAQPSEKRAEPPPPLPVASLYRRGIIMNITNPKVSLFFLAFLPQFVDPARGMVSLQILSLGILFALATILMFGMIALLAGSIGQRLMRNPRTETLLNRTAGIIFAALAIRLLSTRAT